MKKRIALCTLMVLVISLFTGLLSGCLYRSITKEEAFIIFEKGIDAAMAAEFYFYEELDSRHKYVANENGDNVVILRKVNLIGDVDKDGHNEPVKDDNGMFIEYEASVYEQIRYYSGKTTKETNENEYWVGNSVSAKNKKLSSNYILHKTYSQVGNGEAVTDYIRQKSSTEDFVASDIMKNVSLKSKIFDLSLLTFADMDFDIPQHELFEKLKLVSMKFKVKDEFLTKYKETYGRESILKGDVVHIEITYGKFQNMIVSNCLGAPSDLDEMYKFSNVYRGPFIDVPSYDEIIKGVERWVDGKLI